MLIDFEAVHKRHLRGAMKDGVWCFEPVNPSRPRSGVHLSSYQVFSNAGLGVALYVRNDYEGGAATKVHVGLKLTFSRKVDGTFLLQKDDQRISITLDIGGVRSLYAWLAGVIDSFAIEVIRPDTPKKLVTGFESDRAFPLTLRASTSDALQPGSSITVGLGDVDIFHLQMHCLGLAKLLYPSLSDTSILAHLTPRVSARDGQPGTVPTNRAPAHSDEPQVPHNGHGPSFPELDPERCKKAVYAVGKNRWPRQHLPTIEHIQGGPVEAMDRFVRAGNAGDFTEWERLYALLTTQIR